MEHHCYNKQQVSLKPLASEEVIVGIKTNDDTHAAAHNLSVIVEELHDGVKEYAGKDVWAMTADIFENQTIDKSSMDELHHIEPTTKANY